MNFNIIGDPLGTSGYSSHTRQLGIALSNAGHGVSFEFNKPSDWEKTPDPLFKLLFNDYSNEVNLIIGQPDWWPLKLSDRPKFFIGYLVYEGTRIPQRWVKTCNRKDVNQVWVPSIHVYDACVKSGVNPIKLFVVSHGVDTKLFFPKEKGKISDPEVFSFMFNKGWVDGEKDRGGFNYLLKAFLEEFKPEEKVRLLAKINIAYCPQGWDPQAEIAKTGLADRIRQNQDQLLVILENIPFEELIDFYNSGDVFVCSTKSEGFGLTMAEAMACGKPVIATDFGGHLDFVNADNGWLIPYNLTPATGGIQYEETEWAEPNVDELKKLLRFIFNNRDIVKQKGLKALEDIKRFTWVESVRKAELALKDVNI